MKNPSIYKEFENWLFNCNIDSTLREDIALKITNMYILKLMLSLNTITIVMNDVFNTYDIACLDTIEFATYVKRIIIHNNIPRNAISHTKYIRKDVNVSKCVNALVHIKSYEVPEFLKYIDNCKDKDFILNYLDITPLNKSVKKRRKTKR